MHKVKPRKFPLERTIWVWLTKVVNKRGHDAVNRKKNEHGKKQ